MASYINLSVSSKGGGSVGLSYFDAAGAIKDFLQGHRKLSAQEVVDHLKQEPELNELYSLSAGVGEGYSVEEHSRMVVESFEKEFMQSGQTQMILQFVGLSSEEFILFLALHDIGKGRAVQEFYSACPKRKELELRYTQEVIQRIAERYQLRAEAVSIFIQLLNDDAVGDFLKQRNPSEAAIAETKEAICRGARACGVDDLGFLQLKTLFHQVDAASYPFLRERFFESDPKRKIQLGKAVVGWFIDYCPSNLAKMERLNSALSQGSSSSASAGPSSQRSFSQGLDFKSLLKPSVLDYSIAEISSLEEALTQIKLQEGKEGENYHRFKAEVDKVREANFPFRSYLMWKKVSKNFYGLRQFKFFSGSDPKIKENREKKKLELIQRAESQEMQKKLFLLSRLTFLHGSNSATLAMMALQKEPKLQCTGELVAKGIAPMSGELREGVGTHGINLHSISVETVRDVSRVIDYTSSFRFSPDKFEEIENPFLTLSQKNIEIAPLLQRWREEDPEGFQALLCYGSPRMLQLVAAIEERIECLRQEIKAPRSYRMKEFTDAKERQLGSFRQALAMLRGEREWEKSSEPCDYAEIKQWITNPYFSASLSGETGWNASALLLRQMKQWNWQAFERCVLPFADQWMEAVEKERRNKEKPLKLLIAMIDRNLSEEESVFLKAYCADPSSASMAMPDSLLSLFSSKEDIPRLSPHSDCNFFFYLVQREIGYYRKGHYQWESLLSKVLKVKLGEPLGKLDEDLGSQEHLDQLKPIFERQLDLIGDAYVRLSDVLRDPNPPCVQIPENENFRSLITTPFPVIFASTVVKPEPYSDGYNPNEYLLRQAVALGPQGCNTLFTDTAESQEKIRKLLPQVQGVELHLISELDVGDFPLCTAPSQVEPFKQ